VEVPLRGSVGQQFCLFYENKITRDSKTKQLVSKYQEKDLTLGYDKRYLEKTDKGFETFPWGY